ncbi:MAG: ribosome maturation factor RimM [Gemmatimonadaceae bacterium]|nr:ribosome maturation factor RimM [Gemmatimonadaceae bacterium]MCU0626685.1 ribosome maturation factor RimM [Gemmatimonadaceae bacterium]
MSAPSLLLVGRVRKAHGLAGEVLVESMTDAPDVVFTSGRRLFVGTATGDPAPDGATVTITGVRRHGEAVRLRLRELTSREQADSWRGRYFLLPAEEVPPPSDDEVYQHELYGLDVVAADGRPLGTVVELYELPQGLTLEIRPEVGATFLFLWRPEWIVDTDLAARRLVIDPPEGLIP